MSLHKELNFSSAVGSIADEACPGFSFHSKLTYVMLFGVGSSILV